MRTMKTEEKQRILYGVQAFVRHGGELVAEQPHGAESEKDAKRIAQQLAKARAGVIAFKRIGDPVFDDWGDPTVIFKAGAIPADLQDALGA
jgi:hypothetical protein